MTTTESKTMERADLKNLLKAEIRYRRVFEAARDGILILNADTGRIEDANPFMSELLSYSKEYLVGKELWEIGLFRDIATSKAAFAELQKIGYIRYEDLPLEDVNGVRRQVEFVSNVYQENGRKAIQCNIRDITKRKGLEAALRDVARRKDEFLAMLGHELRNPLAGIVNGIQVLKLVVPDSKDADEMREVIERQANHMTHLINDLLDVSRISRGKIQLRKKRVDLAELVQKTAENYRQNMEARQFEVTSPAGPIWVNADPTRVIQVIGNLLNNAYKFTDDGGHITLSLERNEEAATIRVKDTGIGMEPDFLERVFERFSQADRSMDRSRGGLGLGLALVSGLVEMHGGEVKAYSNGLGRGCEFRIRLPLAKEGAPSAPTPSSTEPMKSYRILLIDDRRDAILPLKKMLILLGQKIAVAMDGKTGMETAREFQPEIVLCDIGLPDMDGYAVAQAIRADPKLRSVYLVAVTGYGQEDDRRRAVQSGFDYHLTKPVGKDQLEMLLRKMPRFRVSFDVNDETSE